jgi:beta-galactosidase
MRAWPAGSVTFGGDYNPEQWPRSVWAGDIALMKRAKVSFVSLGIFSWSALEPREGAFEPGWLDDVLDLLAGADIAVDLATATAAPPMWLARAHPEIAIVDRNGHAYSPGSRQNWCPSSTVFTAYATRLTEQMARRYHDHPALAMWHVSNEYGCHNTPCYCDGCAAAFRVWLQRRYGDLDGLNDAWGTSFWSQRYHEWEHIGPPRLTPTFNNPGQVLDYRRFQSDALLDQYLAELAVLREHSPGVPVTTNFMTMVHFRHLDYHRWAPHMDIVSTDHYVVDALPDPRAELAFAADLTRGVAGGRPWMLMEHSTSAVNWQPVNPAKDPGQMVRDSLTHVSRGADTIGFFQWRASRAGAEKYHSGLVPHAGAESRLFHEVCRLGDIAQRLAPVAGSRVDAEVAILWDYEAAWGTMGPALPSSLVDYPDVAVQMHRCLAARHITCDVVHPLADLSPYRLILVPTLYLVSDAAAAAIHAAADAGAHVVVTYFSGIVDEVDHIRLGGYPGAFRDLLGVRTQEFRPLRAGERVELDSAAGPMTGTVWSEDCATVDAEVIATYAGGVLAGQPAVTRRRAGGSSRWYLTTRLDDDGLDAVLALAAADAGVRPVLAGAPAGVDLVRRRGADATYVFALNHTDTEQQVPISGHDLVTDTPVVGALAVAAGAVAVVREG